MLSPLFRRLSALRATPLASPFQLHPLPNPRSATKLYSTASQSQAQTQAQAQARAIADAKRRAILREDFRLPVRLFKGLLLLLTVTGGTLTLHTVAVHTFSEHSSPTPAALDFWTRTHLRRAYMLERFQHDPSTALKYVQKAVEEEGKWAHEKRWAMWRKEYLQLVMRLAHAYLLARRVDEAARVVARVSEELHAKLVTETMAGAGGGAESEQVARLAKLLVQVDGKLAGLYVRMGQAEVAREVAADAVDLARSMCREDKQIVAGAIMAWADACKAGYLAAESGEAMAQALSGYEEVLVMSSAAQSAGAGGDEAEDQEQRVVPFIEEGMPQQVPLACMAAIASYHLGDLLATQRYRSSSPAAAAPVHDSPSSPPAASSWWPFRSSASPTPAAPITTAKPDTAAILAHFQNALSLASTRPNARQCQECQSATLSTVGQVFYREGDQVQAVHFWREGLKVARKVGDVEAEEVCEQGLKGVGVAVQEEEGKDKKEKRE